MRITVVVHDFALGGAERIALRLAEKWTQQGLDVTIVSGACDGAQRPFISEAVRLICPSTPIRRSLTRRGLSRFLMANLKKLDPDVVFLPGNYYFGLARDIKRAAPWVRVAGKISNGMVRAGEGRLKARVRIGLLRWKSRFLDRILLAHEAFQPEVAEFLRRPPTSFATVGQPVLRELPPLASDLPEHSSLIAAGRLVPQKNFDLAIEALAILPDDVSLTIYGEGPLRGALEGKVQELGLERRVRLPGMVPEIAGALADARLFVLSSDYEGFGTVVIEALAQGVPVVATDCSPSMSQFLSAPELGQVVPANDPHALAAGIADQLARPAPPGELVLDAVRPHLIDEVARRYVRVFSDLVA